MSTDFAFHDELDQVLRKVEAVAEISVREPAPPVSHKVGVAFNLTFSGKPEFGFIHCKARRSRVTGGLLGGKPENLVKPKITTYCGSLACDHNLSDVIKHSLLRPELLAVVGQFEIDTLL